MDATDGLLSGAALAEAECVSRLKVQAIFLTDGWLDERSLHSLLTACNVRGKEDSASLVNLAGIPVPHRRIDAAELSGSSRTGTSFVGTASGHENLHRLAIALAIASAGGSDACGPILLEGPPGCGKTTLLRHVASQLGFFCDLVELHLDDASDGKALLGQHLATDVPGEFVWTPGAVTAAVAAGRWLIIEDIDRAPFDVLAALEPLMDGRRLDVPGLPNPLSVHQDFRLFATRTTPARRYGQAAQVHSVSGPFSAFVDKWLRIRMASHSGVTSGAVSSGAAEVEEDEHSDARALVTALHPGLPGIVVDCVLSSFTALQSCGISLDRFGRSLSTTDVLRWARRIAALTPIHARSAAAASSGAALFLTEADRLSVVHEGLSILCGHAPDSAVRRRIAHAVASCWGLDATSADHLLDAWRPTIGYTWAARGAGAGAALHLQAGGVLIPVTSDAVLATAAAGRLSDPLPLGFAPTRHALCLLERLAATVAMNEPCLLVGETGNGKTSVIQALASALGVRLLVANLNVQSDSGDLVGGFRPVHLKQMAMPLLARFSGLLHRSFPSTASGSSAAAYLDAVRTAAHDDKWARVIGGFLRAATKATSDVAAGSALSGPEHELLSLWQAFCVDVRTFERQFVAMTNRRSEGGGADAAGQPSSAAFAFSFQEGVVVQALRTGAWLLLDEINLAPPETLQRLSGLLEGGSITLTEKGESAPVPRHAGFRVFAAMNPSTDFGKRDLAPALRSRFSEIAVADVDDPLDLATIVQQAVAGWPQGSGPDGAWEPGALVESCVQLYLTSRSMAAPLTGVLRDGAATRPHYSLRSLTRALKAAGVLITAGFPVRRAVYEGVCMSFLTQLDEGPAALLQEQILKFVPPGRAGEGAGAAKKKEKQAALAASAIARLGGPPAQPVGIDVNLPDIAPRGRTAESHIQVTGFWLARGDLPMADMAIPGKDGSSRYVLVPSVVRHLRSLARAACVGRFPVLLQGPTSAGKTSMVEYLAARTGHTCVRINNHEHTDLAEYMGSYVTEAATGRLVFSEGLLVRALRCGAWIILDELNLAPSDVLEAMNRLLDDNRELFIPETQTTVRPHPNFMLFATQNPAGAYGGRKPLSRAFRNRFVELHIDDIPSEELVTILAARSRLAPPFLERMVETANDLHRLRQSSDVFAGKHAFVTPRDLLRWAGRGPSTYAALAQEGYALLGERLRLGAESSALKLILERVCKSELAPQAVYDAPFQGFITQGEGEGEGEGEEVKAAPAVVGTKRPEPDAPDRVSSAPLHPSKRSRHILSDEDKQDEFGSVLTRRLRAFLAQLRVKRGGREVETDREGHEEIDLSPGSIMGTEGLDTVTATSSLRRLFHLVGRCIAHDEAVLLVGDTGCGKTTVVQLLALLTQTPLHIVNCHAHSETADFLGSLRPVRNRAVRLTTAHAGVAAAVTAAEEITPGAAAAGLHAAGLDPSAASSAMSSLSAAQLSACLAAIESHVTSSVKAEEGAMQDEMGEHERPVGDGVGRVLALLDAAKRAVTSCAPLFEWHDGPLVTAMTQGHFFLLDEASLAEDAVLERLNSVLEPGRTLTLAEKGNTTEGGVGEAALIKAARGFRFFATMNPGGDFGKRELSPALRNRFTEIWVPQLTDPIDLRLIIQEKAADVALRSGPTAAPHPLSAFVPHMLHFVQWYDKHAASGRLTDGAAHGPASPSPARAVALTLRDIHAWLSFMGCVWTGQGVGEGVRAWEAYAHGACLVLLDGLGLGAGMSVDSWTGVRSAAAALLVSQAPTEERALVMDVLVPSEPSSPRAQPVSVQGFMGVHPFYIPLGPRAVSGGSVYTLHAPSTRSNLLRICRALQTARPVLLEGPPGVGKTSLIEALGRASGHALVRINLSEQTDIADLFGQDLPSAEAGAGGFAWCDGVLLSALRRGDWVLLDELNLAPQAVLEGLNAVLDHRGSVFLPELGQTVSCPPTFRIFAAQNPVGQGGGRKGLPKSFLNRFAKVHVHAMGQEDQYFIAASLFPGLDVPEQRGGSGSTVTVLQKMVAFHSALHTDTMGSSGSGEGVVRRALYGQEGRPWEFNLRDLLRWCALVVESQGVGQGNAPHAGWLPGACIEPAYLDRFRTMNDRAAAVARYLAVFTAQSDAVPLAAACEPGTVANVLGLVRLHTAPVCRNAPFAVSLDHVVLPRAALPGAWRPTSRTEGAGGSGSQPDAALRAGLDAPWSVATHVMEGARTARSMGIHNLPGGLLRPLLATAEAVSHGWPVLLVGDTSSGKTAVVEELAAAVGARLRRLAITPSTDATELLGSFEQADARRSTAHVCHELIGLAIAIHHAARLVGPLDPPIHLSMPAITHVQRALDAMPGHLPVQHMEQLVSEASAVAVGIASHGEAVRVCNQMADVLQRARETAAAAAAASVAARGSFVWVDGALVEALEAGEWLVMDNANFASPSVMDRLNPLLEPGGELLLNECGLRPDGSPRIIKPHPAFRIFLTMTPALGEVSRALRNRCAEVALLSPRTRDGKGGRDGPGGELQQQTAAYAQVEGAIFEALPGSHPVRTASSILALRLLSLSRLSHLDSTFTAAGGGVAMLSMVRAVVGVHEAREEEGGTPPPRRLRTFARSLTAAARAVLYSRTQFTLPGLPSLLTVKQGSRAVVELLYGEGRGGAQLALQDAMAQLASLDAGHLCVPVTPLGGSLAALTLPASRSLMSWLAETDAEPSPLWLSRACMSSLLVCRADGSDLSSCATSAQQAICACTGLSALQREVASGRVHAAVHAATTATSAQQYASRAASLAALHPHLSLLLSLASLRVEDSAYVWERLHSVACAMDVGQALRELHEARALMLLRLQAAADASELSITLHQSLRGVGEGRGVPAPAWVCGAILGAKLGLQCLWGGEGVVWDGAAHVSTRDLERALGPGANAICHVSVSLLSLFESCVLSCDAGPRPALHSCAVGLVYAAACRAWGQLGRRAFALVGGGDPSAEPGYDAWLASLSVVWRRLVKACLRAWPELSPTLKAEDAGRVLGLIRDTTAALNGSRPVLYSHASVSTAGREQDMLRSVLVQPRNVLWRRGGHPGVPRTQAGYQAALDVRGHITEASARSCVPAPVSTLHAMPSLSHLALLPGGTRLAAAEALAAVSAANTGEGDGSLLPASLHALDTRMLADIAMRLPVQGDHVSPIVHPSRDVMDEREAQGVEGGGQEEEVPDANLGVELELLHRLGLTPAASALARRSLRLDGPLVTCCRAWALVQERRVHARVAALLLSGGTVCGEAPDPGLQPLTRDLCHVLRHLALISTLSCNWPPHSLAPLAGLGWALRSASYMQPLRDTWSAVLSSWSSRAEAEGLLAAPMDDDALTAATQRAVRAVVGTPCPLSDYEVKVVLVQVVAGSLASLPGLAYTHNHASDSGNANTELPLACAGLSTALAAMHASVAGDKAGALKGAMLDLAGGAVISDAHAALTVVAAEECPDFRGYHALLSSSIRAVNAAIVSNNTQCEQGSGARRGTVQSAARALAHVSLLRLMLLLPSSVVDPGQAPALKRSLALHASQAAASSKSHRLLEMALATRVPVGPLDAPTGQPTAAEDALVRAHACEVARANAAAAKYERGVVYRPVTTGTTPVLPFSSLFSDMHAFAGTMMHPSRVLDFIESDTMDAAHKAQALTWISSVLAFADQLSARYAAYADVAVPLEAEIRQVARAVGLLAGARAGTMSSPREDSPVLSALMLARDPCTARQRERARRDLACIVGTTAEQVKADADAAHEEKNRELDSGRIIHLVSETDEERAERSFRQAIPDYFQVHFGSLLGKPDAAECKTVADKEAPRQVESASHITKFKALTLASAHVRLYTGATLHGAVDADSHARDAGVAGESVGPVLCALDTLTAKSAVLLDGPSGEGGSSVRPGAYDFYRNPNVAEASVAVKPVHALSMRALQLLRLFPYNEVLSLLLRVADQLMRLDISAPLAAFMAGAELLVTKGQDWEGNAPRVHCLGETLVGVSQLVTRWRRLELASWTRLLAVADLQEQETAAELWLMLRTAVLCDAGKVSGDDRLPAASSAQHVPGRHNALVSPGIDASSLRWALDGRQAGEVQGALGHGQEFVTTAFQLADRFCRGSTQGQFSTRLQLIRALGRELQVASTTPSPSRSLYSNCLYALGSGLCGLASYYSQYEERVQGALAGAKTPVLQQMADQVALHRWDAQSMYAARESASKAHRLVHNAVAAYRAVLQIIVGPVIDAWQPAVQPQPGPGASAPASSRGKGARRGTRKDAGAPSDVLDSFTVQGVPAAIHALSAESLAVQVRVLPPSFAGLPPLHDACRRARSLLVRPSGLFGQSAREARARACAAIAEHAGDVLEVAGALAQDASKGSRMGKRRALADGLRTLVRMGLSPLAASIPSQMADACAVSQCAEGGGEAAGAALARARDAVLRARVLLAAGSVHSDISSGEGRKGAGLAEHANFLSVQQRAHLVVAGTHSTALQYCLIQLERAVGGVPHAVLPASVVEDAVDALSALTLECSKVGLVLEGCKGLLRSMARTMMPSEQGTAGCAALLRVETIADEASLLGLLPACATTSLEGSRAALASIPTALVSSMKACTALERAVEGVGAAAQGARTSLALALPTPEQAGALERTLACSGEAVGGALPVRIPSDVIPSASVCLVTASEVLHAAADAALSPCPAPPALLDALLTDVCTRVSNALAHAQDALSGLTRHTYGGEGVQHMEGAVFSLLQATLLSVQATVHGGGAQALWGGGGAALDGDGEGVMAVDGQDGGEEEASPVSVPDLVCTASAAHHTLHALRLPQLVAAALPVVRALGGGGEAAAPAGLRHAHALLAAVHAAHASLTSDAGALFTATSRLALIISSILVKLLRDGFCVPEGGGEGEEGGGDGGAGAQTPAASGTGIGEGNTAGAKDVSDQIESEDQVLGLQSDPVEGGTSGESKEESDGLDMAGVFEGDMHDVPPPGEDGGEGEEGEEGEEKDLDREVGDSSGPNEQILDEKLWAGGEEEGEGNKPQPSSVASAVPSGASDDSLRAAGDEAQQDKEGGGKEPKEGPEVVQPPADEGEGEGEGGDAPPDDALAGLRPDGPLAEDDPDLAPPPPEQQQDGEGEGEEGGMDGTHNVSTAKEDPLLPEPDVDMDEGREGEARAELPGPEGEGEGEGEGDDEDMSGEGEGLDASATQPKEEEVGGGESAAPPDPPAPSHTGEGQDESSSAFPVPGVVGRGGKSKLSQGERRQEGQEEQGEAQHTTHHQEESMGEEGEGQAGDEGEEEEEEGGEGEGEGEDRQGQAGTSTSGTQGKWRPAPTQQQSAGETAPPAPRWQRKRAPDSSAPDFTPHDDINPFTDPEGALRHWEARLKRSAAEKEGEGEEEEEGGEVQGGDVDVRASSNGATRMLAPRAIEGGQEEQEVPDWPVNEGGEDTAPTQPPEHEPEPTTTVQAYDEDEGEGEGEDAREGQGEGQGGRGKRGASGGLSTEQQVGVQAMDDGHTTEAVTRGIFEALQAAAEDGAAPPYTSQAAVTVSTGTGRGRLQREEPAVDAPLPRMDADGEDAMRAWVEESVCRWGEGGEHAQAAAQAWAALCALTAEPVARLCEGLRLVLEPTLASKLGGEFRSGKRINMRKIIPYIASQFRKDKIWMRRSKPSSRSYQVLLALDDSLSMAPANRGGGAVALEALTVLARGLTRLEVGQVGVVSYGRTVKLLHPLEQPFTDEAGARMLSSFTFSQTETRTEALLSGVMAIMDGARAGVASRAAAASGGTGVKCHQLVFVLSDGLVGTNGPERERIRQWGIEAAQRGLLLVLVIIDKPEAGASAAGDSILYTKAIKFVGNSLVSTSYLDDYPFQYYIVIRDVRALPEVLADAVRQWFELTGGN